MKKKFKVFYEISKTGELKTIETIATDRYEAQNIIDKSFNNGILKKIYIYRIIESVEV